MPDEMITMYKDDLENSNQECEGTMLEKIPWLFHKKISSQGAIRTRRRQRLRSISINYNSEWSSKFNQKSCSRSHIWTNEWLIQALTTQAKKINNKNVEHPH